MNNTCKRCGAPLKPGMKFCPNCGADVSSNNSTDDTKVKVHNTRENQDNPNTNPTSKDKGPYNGSGDPSFHKSSLLWANHALGTYKQCMGRADYWYSVIIPVVAIFILDNVSDYLMDLDIGLLSSVLSFIVSLIELVFVIGFLNSSIQRLHDAGHSGWTILLPIVDILYLLQPTDWSRTTWPRNDYSNQVN